jgi:hypothetical protein
LNVFFEFHLRANIGLSVDFLLQFFSLKNLKKKLILFSAEFPKKSLVTFRGYQSVAKPTNCVLSAKIIVLRENRSITQEKPAIADNRCYQQF